MRTPRWVPIAVALVLAVAYLIWAPHTSDLAAQTARADLFRRSGLVPFWTGWYAGIPTASYSLVTPPLLGWLGPVWVGALSIVGTTLVAVPLLRDAARPTAGATFVAIAAYLDAVSGRATFAVGAAIALAALLAAERRRPVAGVALAMLATVTSPVAGVLLVVALAALFVTDPDRRRSAFALGLGVVAALVVLAVLSRGDGTGYEPFTRTSLLMAVGTAVVVVISPVGRRVKTGATLAVGLLLLAFFVHSPIGANATRIAVLGAAPTLVAAARLSRRWLVVGVALASFLPLAQLHNDVARSQATDYSQAYVAPVLAQLLAQPGVHNHRVELVDTSTEWPAARFLPNVALARGWQRQTDESRDPIFYGRAPLTAASYRAFLDRYAVGSVAVPVGVPIDFGSSAENVLIANGLPYLHQIWSNANWRLYMVDDPAPIVPAPATVTAITDTGLTVDVPSAGTYVVRLRWSPYLVVDGGSVHRTDDGDTSVTVSGSGPHVVHAVWRFP